MADFCVPQVFSEGFRMTRLDTDGTPLTGSDDIVRSDKLVRFTATPTITTPAAKVVEGANGNKCVNIQKPPTLDNLAVELLICSPDPYAHELAARCKLLTDPGTSAVGAAFPSLNDSSVNPGISLELWCPRYGESGDLDPDFPYNWWVFPNLKMTIGVRTFQNEALENGFSGFAYENPNWGTGPNGDWPVDSDRVAQWIPVEADMIPGWLCGYSTTGS